MASDPDLTFLRGDAAKTVMGDILFHAFEVQSTRDRTSLVFNTSKPQDVKEKGTLTLDKLDKDVRGVTEQFVSQSRKFKAFDQKQKTKRSTKTSSVEKFHPSVYAYVAEHHPETMEVSDHSYTDPVTGNVTQVTVRMDVKTNPGRVTKKDLAVLSEACVVEAMAQLHPKLPLDVDFDPATHLPLMEDPRFMEVYFDLLSNAYAARKKELETFGTKIVVREKGEGDHE